MPRTARALDLLAILALVLACRAALFAPLAIGVDPLSVSLADPWRPLAVAVLFLAGRHWRWPRPSILARLATVATALVHRPYRSVLPVFVMTRFSVLLIGFVAVLMFAHEQSVRNFTVSRDVLIDLPARWDAGWYFFIARDGYATERPDVEKIQSKIAFFPALPLLMRGAGEFIAPDRTPGVALQTYLEQRDIRLLWSGVAIALVSFFFALVLLYRWAEVRAGSDAAYATVAFAAAYPFALYFSAPYTESLYLLGAVGAFFAFERERFGLAAAAALLVGLTRPNGVMVGVGLGILALAPVMARAPGWRARVARGLLVAAMPAVGLLLYSGYVYSLTGNPFEWVVAQQAWGRTVGRTLSQVEWQVRTIRNEGLIAYVMLAPGDLPNMAGVVFALAMTWVVWRRLGLAYAAFMLANLLPPLAKGGLLSMGRMTSTLFPQFLALALVTTPRSRMVWLAWFALFQGFLTALFFTWRPVF